MNSELLIELKNINLERNDSMLNLGKVAKVEKFRNFYFRAQHVYTWDLVS